MVKNHEISSIIQTSDTSSRLYAYQTYLCKAEIDSYIIQC